MSEKDWKKYRMLMFALIAMTLCVSGESSAQISVKGPDCSIGEREVLLSRAGEYVIEGASVAL